MKEMNLKEGLFKQEVLHQVEALCTQEKLPACNATCPIHLDIKEIISEVEKGNFQKAYQLYSKTIPFPKIIAYCCNRPCETQCKRNEIGGSINIGNIERALIEYGFSERKKLLFLLKNDFKVAIVGGGLRGLTAAFDLVKKGYKITIYDRSERLGGSLWDLDREALSAHIINDDLKELLQYPIKIEYGKDIPLETLEKAEFFLKTTGADILYIAADTPLFSLGDRNTLVTSNSYILTGSRGEVKYQSSPIYSIYDGRSAATSIDRILKKVSIMAGREKEGPFETALFTNIDDIPIEKGIKKENNEVYTEEEAISEARRCIQCQCLECVKACPFMAHYKSYPKKYVIEIYINIPLLLADIMPMV